MHLSPSLICQGTQDVDHLCSSLQREPSTVSSVLGLLCLREEIRQEAETDALFLLPADLLCYDADTTTAGASPNAAFVSGGICAAPAPPAYGSSNWKSANRCLLDSNANRVLVGNFIQTDSNSIEYCTSLCTSLQYNYAGLESEY